MRKPERPNILMIMADQLRHNWLGCAGADHVSTPNIDGIAERGVRFTQCSTPSPICAPARISLASGLLPHRLGALNNSAYLPIGTPTYYQRLRDYGYHVGCVGKLDLAKSDRYNGLGGARPRAFGWGFTHPVEAEGKMHAGISATPIGPYTKWLDDRDLLQKFHEDYSVTRPKLPWFEAQTRDSVLPTEAFEDVWIGRRAERWLEEIDGDFPWHLLVSFVGPHDPFDPPTEYADRYRGKAMPKPIGGDLDGKPEWIRERAARNRAARTRAARSMGTDEQHVVARRQYSASTTVIDDAVGGVLRALEARGWLENTYIIVTGDHGELLGDHHLYTKHAAYETSMRVPLIVAGPDIQGGRTSEALVELEDVNPTVCDIAGVPSLENIDGRSVLGVVHDPLREHRRAAVTTEVNYRAIQTREWKYIESWNDTSELYDLTADPDETENVIADHSDVVQDLRRQLSSRLIEGEQLRR